MRGDADDEGLCSVRGGLRHRQIGEPHVGRATREAKLAEAPFRPPMDDAVRRLRRELVLGVAEEQQVGPRNRELAHAAIMAAPARTEKGRGLGRWRQAPIYVSVT